MPFELKMVLFGDNGDNDCLLSEDTLNGVQTQIVFKHPVVNIISSEDGPLLRLKLCEDGPLQLCCSQLWLETWVYMEKFA